MSGKQHGHYMNQKHPSKSTGAKGTIQNNIMLILRRNRDLDAAGVRKQ